MEHGCSQHRVGTCFDGGREVLDLAGTAGGDDRNLDFLAHGANHLEVKAFLGAVGVHRVKQNLAGAKLLGVREWLVEVVRRIKEIGMAVENSTVLIIVNNWGIEETELTRPLRDLKAAGAKVTLAATTLDPCETVQHDRYEGETLTPDARLSDVQAADYDLLVVPGGTCNVDRIRVNEDAITLAQEFAHEGKPIAAICHGAWLLVNAGLVAGKTAAPCRYIAADIENAGGHYVDEQLHVDDANGFKLITSRKPDDLDYFVGAIKDALK